MNKPTTLRTAACACAVTAALALAGCGGGGDSSGVNSKLVVGTLLDSNSAPLAGETVVYDTGLAGSQTTTTNAAGQYRFLLPLSSVTGSDTLSFYDPAGHLIDAVPVNLGQNKASVTVTTIAPPAPPPAQQL